MYSSTSAGWQAVYNSSLTINGNITGGTAASPTTIAEAITRTSGVSALASITNGAGLMVFGGTANLFTGGLVLQGGTTKVMPHGGSALVNPLAAGLSMVGFVGYAVGYTMLLKRTTPQNIVIGGAAGAFPPMIGWAVATGSVSIESVLMFALIFMWTPPHFWALALYRRKEYAKVGMPMLPVTHGEEFTRLHILLYTILLLLVSILPYLTGMSGLIYLAGALILGFGFLYYAIALKVSDRPELPMKTFAYSITYLMVLFAVLLVDHYILITL